MTTLKTEFKDDPGISAIVKMLEITLLADCSNKVADKITEVAVGLLKEYI